MDKYSNYMNVLMMNYPVSTDSLESPYSDQIIEQTGGNFQNRPDGGFPPVYVCNFDTDKKEQSDEIDLSDESNKQRAFASPSSVSIQDIMKKRREVSPFIPL